MNNLRMLVRGYIWKAKMFNDAVFEFWTPTDISRGEAKAELLKIAEYYAEKDIENVWRCCG